MSNKNAFLIILITVAGLLISCADTSLVIDQNNSTDGIGQYNLFETIEISASFSESGNIDTFAENTHTPESDNIIPFFRSPLSANEIFEDVKKGGWIVLSTGIIETGTDLWYDFIEASSQGSPATVLIAYYYQDTEYEFEKEKYPLIYLEKIIYDGTVFKIIGYTSGEEKYYQSEYKYIVNYERASENVYVAVNNDTYTYDQLYDSILSANKSQHIDFKAVIHIPK